MEVIIRKQYLKDLRKVPKSVFVEADSIIDKLKTAKSLDKSGVDYKKMQGQGKSKNYYRIRIELKMPSVVVIAILYRGEIYKYFPPKN
jgi:mRNA-degrading endonuclease RelE of RelBE toxin-antitoxin system